MLKVEQNLPAYTNIENIIRLTDAYRQKNNNEEDAKPLFGLGSAAYTNTKAALKMFGIVEENSLQFTSFGREFAFGDMNEKQKVMIKIISFFPPYESLINSVLVTKEQKETPIDYIISFWGKFNFGSTERNRKDAATLLSSILEFIGLVKFTKGRGEIPSRIIWKDNAREEYTCKLSELTTNKPLAVAVDQVEDESFNKYEEDEELTNGNSVVPILQKSSYTKEVQNSFSQKTNVIVKVDMTSWEDEKIRNFFKYINGSLE